jgi:hypothetical protein
MAIHIHIYPPAAPTIQRVGVATQPFYYFGESMVDPFLHILERQSAFLWYVRAGEHDGSNQIISK